MYTLRTIEYCIEFEIFRVLFLSKKDHFKRIIELITVVIVVIVSTFGSTGTSNGPSNAVVGTDHHNKIRRGGKA
jgi:hypothetical protein